MGPAVHTGTAPDQLAGVLGTRAVRAVYQPIVDLTTGAVAGYEALARGPAGTALERPDQLFAAARSAGRLAELDWACRAAAFDGAMATGYDRGLPLFVNTEPAALGSSCPTDLLAVVRRAQEDLSIVIEVTERDLAAHPSELLGAVSRARERGWSVALDDVGADPSSLALMPFLEPDVIKLDLRLIQQRSTTETAGVISAVTAQAERTGASVLAEGIETDEHRVTALAMGASYGQGWLFGRPEPLGGQRRVGGVAMLDVTTPSRADGSTPFEIVSAVRQSRRSVKSLLVPMSRYLENQALGLPEQPVVLVCFQEAANFTPATARMYERIAARSAFTAVLGAGMPPAPAPNIRGATLDEDDPLRGQWTVVVVAPHFAGVLTALDRGTRRTDSERRFDFVVSYQRDLVLEAARSLMHRIAPLTPE